MMSWTLELISDSLSGVCVRLSPDVFLFYFAALLSGFGRKPRIDPQQPNSSSSQENGENLWQLQAHLDRSSGRHSGNFPSLLSVIPEWGIPGITINFLYTNSAPCILQIRWIYNPVKEDSLLPLEASSSVFLIILTSDSVHSDSKSTSGFCTLETLGFPKEPSIKWSSSNIDKQKIVNKVRGEDVMKGEFKFFLHTKDFYLKIWLNILVWNVLIMMSFCKELAWGLADPLIQPSSFPRISCGCGAMAPCSISACGIQESQIMDEEEGNTA